MTEDNVINGEQTHWVRAGVLNEGLSIYLKFVFGELDEN